LEFHPFSPNWAIAGVGVSFNTPGAVYITKDFCRSWTLIANDVYQYGWGDTAESSSFVERLYFIKESEDFRDFVYSDDLGLSFNTIAANAYVFVFLEKQVFYAVYDFTNAEVMLYVSPDIGASRKTFYLTEFPFGDELENNGYVILDDHTGAVYMGVNHGDVNSHWGHVYVSDSIGYRYSLSSPHTRFQYSSSGAPNYDFDRINALDGVYLSNVLFNWDDEEAVQDEVQSFITLNNGGSWKQLIPPTVDMNGQPYTCTGPCYLHLHGWTSYNDESTQYGPFYSVENAVGLIIGSGNVGEFLSFERDEVRTYFSRDGGVTWKEIHSGPSIYEFADDGGVLVLAPFGEMTNTIYYSLDEATTPLVAYQLPVAPLDIDNIFTEPSATGMKVVISGTRSGVGYLIGVDFSAVFSRNCTSDDYELWAPEGTTPINGLNCQLGKQVLYQRRKPSAQCWNPNVDHVYNVTACTCTEDDWECDFGYERLGNGSCILDMEPTSYPPENCEGTYYKTKGYRKEAGNICSGGVDHSPAGPYSCDGNSDVDLSSNKGWIAAVVIVPLVVLLVIGAFFAIRSEKLREKLPFLDTLQSWKDGYLKVNATPGESVLDEEYIVGPLDEEAPHSNNDFFQGQDDNFDPRN